MILHVFIFMFSIGDVKTKYSVFPNLLVFNFFVTIISEYLNFVKFPENLLVMIFLSCVLVTRHFLWELCSLQFTTPGSGLPVYKTANNMQGIPTNS